MKCSIQGHGVTSYIIIINLFRLVVVCFVHVLSHVSVLNLADIWFCFFFLSLVNGWVSFVKKKKKTVSPTQIWRKWKMDDLMDGWWERTKWILMMNVYDAIGNEYAQCACWLRYFYQSFFECSICFGWSNVYANVKCVIIKCICVWVWCCVFILLFLSFLMQLLLL